ncbi:hypothetical protein ACIP79_31465 [Streptomyces sp. NPDC088747]|uniref:hypothetical protein n=1 Tax=Streptomyces sp. NPDC088747 TaxID=3365886 RepID=UPI00382CA6B4
MPHVEPARLLELALGNSGSNGDLGALRHIASCDRCRQELSRLTRLVVTARSVEEPDLPTAPPERVWQRLKQDLSLAAEPAPPACAEPVRPLAPGSAEPRYTRGSTETQVRTVRVTLALLSGIVVWWWSRSARRPGRRD